MLHSLRDSGTKRTQQQWHWTGAAIRRLLQLALPTDADFSAFCVDCYPNVYAEFSDGMERSRKATLLLAASRASYPELVDQLLLYKGLSREHQAFQAIFDECPEPDNPYRGLSAFSTEDASIFFGRRSLTRRLRDRFVSLVECPESTRLLCILGPSGAGKSSVARAGLLAALKARPLPQYSRMRVLAIKPGATPLDQLVIALRAQEDIDWHGDALPGVANHDSSAAMEDLLGIFQLERDTAWVILIDQFEEIYSLCHSSVARDILVAILLHVARQSLVCVSVIIALRSDFLRDVHEHHPELACLLQGDHVELVPPLEPAELREAIAAPAEHAGLPLDDETIESIAQVARGVPGALPLMQFTLARVFDGMLDGKAAAERLRELGGVQRALAQEADRLFSALTPSEQTTARRCFLRLVHLADDGRETGRRLGVSQICPRGQPLAKTLAVLRRFAGENRLRLLTLGNDEGEPTVELTHEALLQHWSSLRTWLAESRPERLLHKRAAEAAALWVDAQGPVGRLWRPPDLDLLRVYAERHQEDLTEVELRFLAASEAAWTKDRQRRRMVTLMGLGLLMLLFVALAFALHQQQRRIQEAAVARERDDITRETLRQQLLATYVERGRQVLVEKGQPHEAALWLSRAYSQGAKDPTLPFLLSEALRPIDAERVLLRNQGIFGKMSFSRQRSLVALADRVTRPGRRIRIWNIDNGMLDSEVPTFSDADAVALSADGRWLVVSDGKTDARIWNLTKVARGALLSGHTGPIHAAEFSPDGQRVLTCEGSAKTQASSLDSQKARVPDATARIWDTRTGKCLAILTGHRGAVSACHFNPNGQQIVTAGADGTVRLWDAITGRPIRQLPSHTKPVLGAQYSANGQELLTYSSDIAAIDRLAEQQRSVKLQWQNWEFVNARLSDSGDVLLLHNRNGKVVALLRGQSKWQKIGTESFRDVELSPDGRTILTANYENVIHIWDAETGYQTTTLPVVSTRYLTFAFSLDGYRFITGSDSSVQIWHTNDLAGYTRNLTGIQHVEERKLNAPKSSRIQYSQEPTLIIGPDCNIALGRAGVTMTFRPGFSLLPIEQNARVHGIAYSLHRPSNAFHAFGPTEAWNVIENRRISILREPTPHMRYRISPDGKLALDISPTWKSVGVWRTDTGDLIQTLKGDFQQIDSAEFSPDSKHITISTGTQFIDDWDTNTWQHRNIKVSDVADFAQLSSDNHHLLVTGGQIGTRLHIYPSGGFVTDFQVDDDKLRRSDNIRQLSPDSNFLMTGGHMLRIWSLETGHPIVNVKDGEQGAFALNKPLAVTWGRVSGTQVWDLSTGSLRTSFPHLPGERMKATPHLAPNGLLVALQRGDTLYIHETPTGRLLRKVRMHSSEYCFREDGTAIVTVDERQNSVEVWNLGWEHRTPIDIERLLECRLEIKLEGDAVVPHSSSPAGCQLVPGR